MSSDFAPRPQPDEPPGDPVNRRNHTPRRDPAPSKEELDLELEELLADLPSDDSPNNSDSASTTAEPELPAEPKSPGITVSTTSTGSSAPPSAAPKASSAPPTYMFPVGSTASSRVDLNQAVDELSRRRRATDSTLVSYWSIRDELCAVQLALNNVGLRPPAFRPTRRSPPLNSPDPQHLAISRDRKMIDLHWLHCTGFRRPLNDGKYRDLMTADEFDFAAAEQFVSENWKTNVRVNKILGLSEVEQWQMGVLVSDAVRKQRTTLEARRRDIEQALRSLAQRSRHLQEKQATDLSDLWFADALCDGKNLDLIGRVLGWVRGEPPLAATTLTTKRKTMQKRVAQALAPRSTAAS